MKKLLPFPEQLKRARAAVLQRVNGTSFGSRYLNDLAFRSSVSVYQGMTVNFLHVAFRVLVGIRYASVWFLSMAAYYLVLGGMRLSLILSARKHSRRTALRCYRRTAWLLFLLNLPMGGMILLMVLTDSGYSYPGYVIYLSAAYTFYMSIRSAVNLARFRRLDSPILSAARVLNFVAALISVLGLQTATIAQFSAGNDTFRRTMNAATGAVVWCAVILTAMLMLRRSRTMKKEDAPLNRSESKYFATAARMDEAFLALIEQKDFAYITVKELCEKAGVNRSTFYLHYETLSDLLAECSQRLVDQFVAYMPQDTVEFLEKLQDRPLEELYLATPEYLTPYLNYILEHRRIFRATVEQAAALRMDEAYAGLNRHVLTPILNRFRVPPERQKYVMAFYINGLVALLNEWLKNDCKESIEDILSAIQLCIPPHRQQA